MKERRDEERGTWRMNYDVVC